MLKLNYTCVKNVNRQRINSSKSSSHLSTLNFFNKIIQKICSEIIFLNYHLNHYSTIIYTGLQSDFHLLNKSFTHYPQRLLICKLIKER